MIEKLIKKTMRGISILMAMTAVVPGVTALRPALYAPTLLNDILHTIGD